MTNLQGDVVAIIDADGNPVVQYTYDAWGKILSISGPMADTLGAVNPLTYRGYVYDTETDLYYLESRYYDPAMERFINADALVSTGQGLLGNNMFVYCLNNPINLFDPSGSKCDLVIPVGKVPESTQTSDEPGTYDQEDDFIFSQKTFKYADLAFGLSTFANSGCLAIAVYNGMLLYDRPQSLRTISHELLDGSGVILWGLGGLMPYAVSEYLNNHEIPYTTHTGVSSLCSSVDEGDIIIFTIMNNYYNVFDGFHTMAAQYINGEYMVYNVYSNGTKAYTFQSLDQIYENSLFLIGYVLEK